MIRRTLKERTNVVAVALVVALALGLAAPRAVHAASDEQICQATTGCTYTKVQGVSQCECVVEPPNQPNSGGVTKSEEEATKGSTKSSHETVEEDCVNNNGGAHCK